MNNLPSKGVDMNREREFGADCIRILALCLVYWVHFYLRNGFYSSEASDVWGFIAVMFRPVFMCCVPLFMVLTGYLKCGKEWSWKYYLSLLPILISYVLISAIHLPYKIFWQNEVLSVRGWIKEFLAFELAEYGWYIGMYIGLFLLSPFVNILWNNIKKKKTHAVLVLTCILLTFFTATVNSLASQAGVDKNILPAYFTSLYYVTYYILGCYIKTYKPEINRIICMAMFFALAALQAFMNIYTRTNSKDYYSGYKAGYNSVFIGAMTFLLFLTFYRLKCNSETIRKIAAMISGVVLEMYLLSYIFDSNIYKLFYKQYPMRDYCWVGLLMTLAVFVLSFAAGKIVNMVTRFINHACLKLICRGNR